MASWTSLPPELQRVVALEALPDQADVRHLSCSNRAMHALLGGVEALAGWLWTHRGHQAVFKAATFSDLAVLRHLIEVHGANVVGHAKLNGSVTLLQLAGISGRVDIVRELLRDPVFPVNEESANGLTCLHMVATTTHTDVVEELLRHPAIAANRIGGMTALHIASSMGRMGIVRKLLQHPGILVNAASLNDGETGLHRAAAMGHVDTVRELLAHPDIGVDLANRHGFTALQYARDPLAIALLQAAV